MGGEEAGVLTAILNLGQSLALGKQKPRLSEKPRLSSQKTDDELANCIVNMVALGAKEGLGGWGGDEELVCTVGKWVVIFRH